MFAVSKFIFWTNIFRRKTFFRHFSDFQIKRGSGNRFSIPSHGAAVHNTAVFSIPVWRASPADKRVSEHAYSVSQLLYAKRTPVTHDAGIGL